MRKIFILEDDDDVRELIRYALADKGFDARGFNEPDACRRAMEISMPDMLILDIGLPKKDGISILKELRSQKWTRALPVILVTARNSEYDRILGLDSGADDYISKPFSVMELISRVKAVLRRTDRDAPTSAVFEVGPVKLNMDRRSIQVNGEEVYFTHKEFQLLFYLIQREGTVVSRDELMQQVWGFGYEGESRTVDVHIKTIRTKLGSHGAMIKTIRSVGYMLDAELLNTKARLGAG